MSGEIEIESFSHADAIAIESISGDIKLDGQLSPGGIYEINSHSGNVELGIPYDSHFELRVETFSGKIQCDFELTVSGKIDHKRNPAPTKKTKGFSSHAGGNKKPKRNFGGEALSGLERM